MDTYSVSTSLKDTRFYKYQPLSTGHLVYRFMSQQDGHGVMGNTKGDILT